MPKPHQEPINGNPKPLREYLHEGVLRRFRCPGGDPSQSVGNSVHVGIDTDCIDSESQAQHKIGSFGPDAGKGRETLPRIRDLASKIGMYPSRNFFEMTSLRFVEARRIDQFLDELFVARGKILWGGCFCQ